MNILIITTGFPRFKGDMYGKVIYELVKHFTNKHNVKVLAPHDAGIPLTSIERNIFINRFRYFFPTVLQKLSYGKGGIIANMKKSIVSWINLPFFLLSFLINTLRLSKYCDIIHAQWIISGFIGLFAKFIYKKPLLLTIRNAKFKDYPPVFARFVLKRVDWIISPHPELSDKLKKMGINNFSEIPNPVAFNDFRMVSFEEKEKIKEGLNLSGKNVILFTARFDDWKDPVTFVESIPGVIKKNRNVKFIMLGDGVLMDTIKTMITELKISDYIECNGFATDVHKYIAAADIFVAISKLENVWSNTVVEAILSGIPCILSKAGYTERFFNDGENAALVNISDRDGLSEKIDFLLKNPSLIKKISENAKRLLLDLGFSEEKIITGTMSVYRKLLNVRG